MDGLLLPNGSYMVKDGMYHLDMVHKYFPDCKSEREAVDKYKCIFVVEYRDMSGCHCKNHDYLILHGDNHDELTDEQMSFLKKHINELSMSQLIQIPELAIIKGLFSYENCSECMSYCDRFDFLNGKRKFDTYLEQQQYYSGNYKPDDYCECCKRCELNEP